MADSTGSKLKLLDLPIEIRLRIFRICVSQQDPLTKVDWVRVDLHSGRFLVKTNVWNIFEVCGQVYREVMPEYYALTEFHFSALSHLRQTIASHSNFRNYARHVVLSLDPYTLPTTDEVLGLKNLQLFTLSNIVCHEPIGTGRGLSLHHATLKLALDQLNSRTWDRNTVNKIMDLHKEVTSLANSYSREVNIIVRFRYSYIEKSKHPDGWGGSTAKRSRIIDYNCRNDTFTLQKPEPGEIALISGEAF